MRPFLKALALAVIVIATPALALDDATKAQLKGRTLNVTSTFDNSGSGARLWSVLADALRDRLPDTQIRARFDDAGNGIKAVNELFADTSGSLSIVFGLMPELAFAQSHNAEGVAFDLNKAQWIGGLQREGQIMGARKGLSTDIEALRQPGQRLIIPVDTAESNGAILHLLLDAVTGIHGQLVVGFSSSQSQRALVVGDADLRRQQLAPDVDALLESGEIQSLYVISGSGFPPQVDTSRTLASVAMPGTPQAVLDYITATTELGRAFLAAPTADPKDVAALQAVLADVMSDPAVLDQIAKQFAVETLIPASDVGPMMARMLLSDPDDRAAVELAYQCGQAMSRGTLDHCDFSKLTQ